jgi:ribosomal protein L30
MAETQVVRSLFVTLRRGMAGKPWFHRRVIDSLGLSRRHECIEKPNNASIRGMLMKVRGTQQEGGSGAAEGMHACSPASDDIPHRCVMMRVMGDRRLIIIIS